MFFPIWFFMFFYLLPKDCDVFLLFMKVNLDTLNQVHNTTHYSYCKICWGHSQSTHSCYESLYVKNLIKSSISIVDTCFLFLYRYQRNDRWAKSVSKSPVIFSFSSIKLGYHVSHYGWFLYRQSQTTGRLRVLSFSGQTPPRWTIWPVSGERFRFHLWS